MPVSREHVERISHLARLSLSAEQIEKFCHELTIILDYVDQLRAVNTEEAGSCRPASDFGNLIREDSVRQSLQIDKALFNARDHDDQFFRVPTVIG